MPIGVRIPVATELHARLVLEELDRQIATTKAFTAYNITRAVRHRQPRLEISHRWVRLVVHRFMRNLILEGRYEAAPVMFHDERAILYVPVEARDAPSSLLLLPLN